MEKEIIDLDAEVSRQQSFAGTAGFILSIIGVVLFGLELLAFSVVYAEPGTLSGFVHDYFAEMFISSFCVSIVGLILTWSKKQDEILAKIGFYILLIVLIIVVGIGILLSMAPR